MANSLNSNPIVADTDFAGWKAAQTLYAAGKAVFGRVYKIELQSAGVTLAGVVSIQDPNDNTVLWSMAVPATAGASGTVIKTEDFTTSVAFRDFKITGLTATVSKIFIWYRA